MLRTLMASLGVASASLSVIAALSEVGVERSITAKVNPSSYQRSQKYRVKQPWLVADARFAVPNSNPAVSPTRFLGGELLPVAVQMRRDGHVGREEAQVIGG
jgi:hypothetical protein